MTIKWTIEAHTRRQQGHKWLAKIIGLNSNNRSGLDFDFLSPISQESGKVGTKKAVFEITEPGFYCDSDGDYIKVFEKDGKLNYESTTCRDIKAAIVGIGDPID